MLKLRGIAVLRADISGSWVRSYFLYYLTCSSLVINQCCKDGLGEVREC